MTLAHRQEIQKHKQPHETGQLDQTYSFLALVQASPQCQYQHQCVKNVEGAAASTLIGLPLVCVMTVPVGVIAVAAENTVAVLTGVRAGADVVTVPATVGLAAVLAASEKAGLAAGGPGKVLS